MIKINSEWLFAKDSLCLCTMHCGCNSKIVKNHPIIDVEWMKVPLPGN